MNGEPNSGRQNTLDFDTPKLLIQAAEAILGGAAIPNLSGLEKRQVQLAKGLLNAVIRQIEFAPQLASLDAQSLEQFGLSGQDSIADLAKKISKGEVEVENDLIMYLKQRTLFMLAIDNPKYWGYVEAKKRWTGKHRADF